MRVLVLSHLYPSLPQPTHGVFVHEQVKALVLKGVDVRVFSPVTRVPRWAARWVSRWKRRTAIPAFDEWEGIPVQYPRYLAIPGNRLFASSGRRLHRALRADVDALRSEWMPDLIHAHVVLPSGAAAERISQDLGIPYVMTIHGLDLLRSIDRGRSYERAIGRAMDHAASTIVVSQRLETIAHERFPRTRGKTVVIGNGVDPEKLAHASPTSNAESSPLTILSVSNLIATKGIDLNLEAIALIAPSFPSLRYDIVGSGPEEEKLRALAASLGIEDRVVFHGRLAHRDVLRRMGDCDVFSLPSWREAQGVVYLEAMALARPVIGCSTEGISEIVQHGETGWLAPPQDVDGLAEGLSVLLGDVDTRHRIGQKARSLILRDHTWESSAEKVHSLYERVLEAGANS